MRILAVDPGDERIGLALSDPTATIARPLQILIHQSRKTDAQRIVDKASQHGAEIILVGLALDNEGSIGPQARKALRLVAAIKLITEIQVITWDESGSTQQAKQGGTPGEAVDARAAAVILQDFLDADEL